MTVPSTDRRPPAGLLATGSLALAAAVFLLQLPFFFAGGADEFLTNAGYHAYVLAWMLAVTALGRTLPLRTLAAAFFAGVFATMAIVLAVGFPLAGLLGRDSRLFDSALVPLLEEGAKGLPILLTFWVLARRGSWQPSMTDGLVVGYLIGTGFALHEDAMYGRLLGRGFAGADWSFLFPSIQDSRLMPSGRLFAVGHAEWTALLGLSIGVAFFVRDRFRWWWAVPAAAFAVIALDHGRVNYLIGTPAFGEEDLIRVIVRQLVLDGRLTVYLLVAGTVAAVVAELVVLRTMAGRDRLFPGIPLSAYVRSLGARSVAALRDLRAARDYARARRSVHYAIWRARPRTLSPQRVASMGLGLVALGERAGLTFAATTDGPAPEPSARA